MKSFREQLDDQLKLLAQFVVVAVPIGGGSYTALTQSGASNLLAIFISLLSIGLVICLLLLVVLAKNQQKLIETNGEDDLDGN